MKKIKAKVEEALKFGYVHVYRNLINWEWFTDPNTCHLFIYCLLKANHSRQKWLNISINRGSFVTSLSKLADNTGLSLQQVRTSLNKLKSTNDLTYTSTNKYTVLTVRNYSDWQPLTEKNNTEINTEINKQITNKQQTNNKQITTNNNDNNDNNLEREFRENFEIFIKYAELKGAKNPTAYASKVLKETSPENIQIVIQNLKKEIKKEEEKLQKKAKIEEEKKEAIFGKQEIMAVEEYPDDEILKILSQYQDKNKGKFKNPVLIKAQKEAEKRGLKL